MNNHPDMVESLRTVRHFRDLSLSDLHAIISSGKIRHVPGNTCIFNEGEPCAGMFVLMKGRVHLCKLGPQGQTNIMAIIEPVIMFNEITVLDGGPNPVTAFAIKDSFVWQIGYKSFQNLLARIPQVGLSLLRVLATRNRQMIDQYGDLSFRSVVARTSKLLLDLSNLGQKTITRRDCSIEEMAARVATVPEAISRSLNMIKTQGGIRVSRTEIVVISTEILIQLAQIAPQLLGE